MIARLKQLPLSPTLRSVITEDRPNIFPYNIPSSEDYETLLATTQAHVLEVIPVTFEDTPTWRIPINTFCPDQNYPLKQRTHPTEMRNLFLNHASTKHANSTHIYTDGSKTNGAVGCAAAYDAAAVSRRLSSSSSIYTAELVGVSCALSLIDQLPGDDFTIFVDSKSVVQALRAYNSRHPIVWEILTGLVRLAGAGRAVSVCWVPGHVGVRGNERADEAAVNAASSDQAIHSEQVPCREHYPIIKASIRHIWQEQWLNVRENKLRTIKDCVRAWSSSYQISRKMEVALCRLRIGHTRLTHSYLIERRPMPYCNDCLVPLTVLHVMAECPSHSDTRQNHYPNTTALSPNEMLSRMLREVPRSIFRTDNLRQYIIECDLLPDI
jgi:ribonuclease HI